jgi:hypothetical protein
LISQTSGIADETIDEFDDLAFEDRPCECAFAIDTTEVRAGSGSSGLGNGGEEGVDGSSSETSDAKKEKENEDQEESSAMLCRVDSKSFRSLLFLPETGCPGGGAFIVRIPWILDLLLFKEAFCFEAFLIC